MHRFTFLFGMQKKVKFCVRGIRNVCPPSRALPHALVCLSYTLTFVPTLKVVDAICRNAQTPSKPCSICANRLEVEFASLQCARVDTGGDFLYCVYASERNLLARHAFFMSNPSIHFLYGTQKYRMWPSVYYVLYVECIDSRFSMGRKKRLLRLNDVYCMWPSVYYISLLLFPLDP